MIFATVGTQLPFDRLIDTLDKYKQYQRDISIFAQIGPLGKSPDYIDWAPTLTAKQFAKKIAECKVIISHAGMGTILTALELGKPIIVMPRQAKYGEHRNDHQCATVQNLRGRVGIHVADDEQFLLSHLKELTSFKPSAASEPVAEPKLLNAISQFITEGKGDHNNAF